MATLQRASILSSAYAVPPKIRTNDDPIFDYVKKNVPDHDKLFYGYKERRVLEPKEQIEPYMVAAAQTALDEAGLAPSDVDVLLGYVSIGQYFTPNSLAYVHEQLGLKSTCWAMPIQADYSNYSAGLLVADAMITSGRAANALIVAGSNWSQNVSYMTPPCVSIGDGAGAVVMGPNNDTSLFRVVDYQVEYTSTGYGGMFTASDQEEDFLPKGPKGSPFNESLSHPYFHLTPQGVIEFQEWGTEDPPKVVQALLTRNALSADEVALVSYQASAMLVDAWQKALQPKQMLHTLEQFGNLVIAVMPVNFAYYMKSIETDYAVLLSLGAEPHASAILLRRNG
jgi:3-oxoacyl-[acyl-carrier-protein] synthase-3